MRQARCDPLDWGGRASADNALAEAFNATLKHETLAGAFGWDSPAEARRAVFAWITRLRHCTCGQLSPIAYETRYTLTTLRQAA